MRLESYKKSTWIFALWSLSILLTILSCDSNLKGDSTSNNQREVEMIFDLIAEGRNIQLPLVERKKRLEEAQNAISTIEGDSSRAKLYSRLSLAYLRLNDSLKFRNTNKSTIELSKKVDDSISLAEAKWDLALFLRKLGVPDSAYFHYSEAQKIYSDLGMSYESGRMLYNMASAQSDIKDYTGGEITTIQAIETLKPFNKNQQLFNCYNLLGIITRGLKEYDRAIEYYNTALEYQKEIPEQNNLDLIVKNNIGIVYQEQEKYHESIPYFEEVLQNNFLIEENPDLYAKAMSSLAYSRLKVGDENQLQQQFEKAIRIQDSINDISAISRTQFNLAEFFLNQKDTLSAIEHAKKARNSAELTENNERILQTLKLLAKLEPEKSAYYTQQYITLNDSLQQEERKVRDKFARIRFETDEFIAENQMLTREKQLWTGISIAVLLLGLMTFLILDQRSKNQKLRFHQEQQVANQEIFNLMLAQKQKVEEGKKSEQKRISEELHDGVLGKMLGARMVLTGLNQKNDQNAVVERKRAIDALQDVEKEVRAISHELSHAAYQKMHNFILSLEDLIKTVENTAGFKVQMHYDKNFDWDALKGEAKINLYRIIQECLQNSVKHARCENVTIDLEKFSTMITITIADDGQGFKNNSGRKGIGMRNIESRVEKLNGEWDIKGVLGKGTTVRLEFSLSDIMENGSLYSVKEKSLKEISG
ncbi:tetratricopeptide repeat-containing sensor histidine kinase [Pareuzebyella sediminis]|uniref:tetratricopeptide repeat-containing sensor histidine kinase n=1 Tax=Pareuzebyella sediminis TaxID=2607998 RepID=UPI0011EC2F66|nr:tetratricopeptide repeat-containing sensor histidine kinase [Pareuzebyella sediminis]